MASWITPENVITIASHLMNMDKSSFHVEHQRYLESWVFNLREALGQYLQYNNPTVKCFGLSNVDMIEYHFRTLFQYTKAFVDLLTSEAKEALREAVLDQAILNND